MRLLIREWRPLSLMAALVAVLALSGLGIRYRVAVEVQFFAQDGHQAVWHLRRQLGPDEVSVLHDILVSDPKPRRRDLAAHRLSLELDPRSVPLLINAMWDADPDVGKSAYYALHLHDGDKEAYQGWILGVPERRLLELVRGSKDPRVQWGLFLEIVKTRRPAMVAAGEALLETSPSVDKLSLSLLALDSMRKNDFTPQEKALIARFMRLGVDDSDAQFRRVCRSRVALADASSLTEQELVDWSLDLEDAEYVLECDDILALLTELDRRAPARFDDTVAKLLATCTHYLLSSKLVALVDGLSDPWRQAGLLRSALQNPEEGIREHAAFLLEHLDFRNEYSEVPRKRERK